MKKVIIMVLFVFAILILTGCIYDQTIPKAVDYYINSSGKLVVIYDNKEEVELGAFDSNVAELVDSIEIKDGRYIINGIRTNIKAKSASSYTLDKDNNLIVTYDDETYENLGNFNFIVANSLSKVEVSEDGYYIINDIKTNIKIVVPKSYAIDSNSHLIVTYTNGTKKDLGLFTEEVINSLTSVEISDSNKYVINGIETEIEAITPKSYSFDDNGHLIVVYSNNTKKDLGDFSSNIVDNVHSVTISEDGFYLLNGIKTDIKAFNTYSISFDTGFTTKVEPQLVRTGEKVNQPQITRKGYTLVGWYSNNVEWNFDNYVFEDIILTAKWTANQYKVSFSTEKGISPSAINVTYDSAYTLPKLDNINNYSFDGWYYNGHQVLSNKWDIDSNVTLIAKWVEHIIELDTTWDEISIKDLMFAGLSNQTVIPENKNAELYFDKTNKAGSLKFKFYYDIKDTTKSESNAVLFNFDVSDNKWDQRNCLWLRGDGLFLAKYDSQKKEFVYEPRQQALSSGIHEVEFGRIAYLDNGIPTGKYYVYYKVDGVLKDSSDQVPYDTSKMDGFIFISFGSTNYSNKIYDISMIPGYENPDRITISDLLSSGKSAGVEAKFIESKNYSYLTNSVHKSVIFNFLYEIKNKDSIDTKICFDNTLNETGLIWFNNDKNVIKKSNGSLVEASAFKEIGIYNIEIGKLYITEGENIGKYYIFVKVDGNKILESVEDVMPQNANVYLSATNNVVLYDINYLPIELNSSIYEESTSLSGIQFDAVINKDLIDKKGISELGFIIYSLDDPSNVKKVAAELVESENNYIVSARTDAITEDNVVNNYIAKLYYRNGKYIDYSNFIVTSFYDLIGDSEEYKELKESILYVLIDEDTEDVVGATKQGDFSSSSIVLTGPKSLYRTFVVNGVKVDNDTYIEIGYYYYKVTLEDRSITLTKQDKNMLYGASEHFNEINRGYDTKLNATNLSPQIKELGVTTVRLDIYLGDLFQVTPDNRIIVNYSHKQKIQSVIDELKKNGGAIDFLAVFSVIQPYGFEITNPNLYSRHTCPNPTTQGELYLEFLKLNGEAARLAASLFPDIKNYEAWNEPEMMCEVDGPLAKPDGTNYSVNEKIQILTDLMYYYNIGIKEANPHNKLSTPSMCCAQLTNSDFDVTSLEFCRRLYQAITDDIPVTGLKEVDKNPNNYFQAINIHPYTIVGTTEANWKNYVSSFHTISSNFGDSGTEIWITEFGYAFKSWGSKEDMVYILGKGEEIDSLTKLYFYTIRDHSSEDSWGLFDWDGNIKEEGKAVRDFIRGEKDN